MIMGDGDCGEVVKMFCELVLVGLDVGWVFLGFILFFLGVFNVVVDDMGGIFGVIFGIFFLVF